ncbi:MAG: ATP-binding protein [Candidatus Scalindua sp.]|nr:ATP-binding protein [Candidatus Scalindua sp.]MBT6053416.1 ATP-binding protein [Candidatus Scalindua sp.]MBT6226120.1 ATP-binding protein [Candidatus Scalindua sp.]
MRDQIESVLRQTPQLKGSEIAKKIGVKKKKVNSFLYVNQDIFVQNSDFRWSIINPNELTIEFESGQWIDCSSFENSLKSAGLILESEAASIVFILPNNCKMLLVVTARFLALCNQLIARGKKVAIDFNNCKQSLTYLDRLGFLDQLDKKILIRPERPTSSRAYIYKGNSDAVVELGNIDPDPRTDNNNLIVRLIDTFVGQSSEDYRVVATTIFGELIENISEHSNTPIPGFAALQRYEGRKKHIQTVVSDSGEGIAKTLRPSLKQYYPSLYERYKDNSIKSDIGLVTEVLTKGDISRFGGARGLGLKSSREQAIKFNARFSVRQECYSLEFVYEDDVLVDVNEEPDLIKICGTHVCFDFYC